MPLGPRTVTLKSGTVVQVTIAMREQVHAGLVAPLGGGDDDVPDDDTDMADHSAEPPSAAKRAANHGRDVDDGSDDETGTAKEARRALERGAAA